jgi:tetratricopeptide (TPR) repeat protein
MCAIIHRVRPSARDTQMKMRLLGRWDVGREIARKRSALGEASQDHGLSPREEANLRQDIGEGYQRLGRFKRAAKEFAELERFISPFPELEPLGFVARMWRMQAYICSGESEGGLAIADGLIAVLGSQLIATVSYPNVLVLAYAARWITLEQMGRLEEARSAARELVDRYRPGRTVVQRNCVMNALVAVGRITTHLGAGDEALAALDEAIIYAQAGPIDSDIRVQVAEAMLLKAGVLERDDQRAARDLYMELQSMGSPPGEPKIGQVASEATKKLKALGKQRI